MINKESIDKLESSGIIDGYEYVLRKLIQSDLPKDNCYEKCAYYLIEYQKLILEDNIRTKGLKNFLSMAPIEEKPVKQETKLKEVMPSYKLMLKSRMLLENEENVKFEDKPLIQMNIEDMINNHIEMASEKIKKSLEEKPIKYKESFASYVNEENSKLRSFIFKTAPKYKPFEFIPIKEISRMNQSQGQGQKRSQKQDHYANQDLDYDPHGQYRNNPNIQIKDDPQDDHWTSESNTELKKVSKEFISEVINSTVK